MKEFLEFIAKNLVYQSDNVMIDSEEKDGKLVFKLKVADGDVGKVIGRGGKTASAIRVLLRAVAAKEKKRVILDIVG